MKKLFKIVLACGLTLICFSCYYNEFPELEDIIIDDDEVISFSNDILPIFATYNCTNCHNGRQEPDLRVDNAYNSLVPSYVTKENANNSELYKKLAVENHQNLDVDANSLALIKKWIDDGAENN